MSKVSRTFQRFAETTSRYTGRPVTFLLAVLVIVVWAVTGPIFHFNDTWQLVINTGTTIITFLMVFLIQSSQNRDSAALQIKLDELIRVTEARNTVLDLEDIDEESLERLRKAYRRLGKRHQERGGDGAPASAQPARPPSPPADDPEIDREIDRACAERDEEEARQASRTDLSSSPGAGRAAGG